MGDRWPPARPAESPPLYLQFVDMKGWALLGSDRQPVPVEWRADTELLHADLRQGPEALPELYWQAPPSYLGDRVSGAAGREPGGPAPG